MTTAMEDDFLPDLGEEEYFPNDVHTPPESVYTKINETENRPPEPGRAYIIRSLRDGREITLLGGRVVLAEPGGLGSSHWVCMRREGWYGFQNAASYHFLGHDNNPAKLICSAEKHREWERFHFGGLGPEGGYVLLMKHWSSLLPVGTKMIDGVEMLARIDENEAGSIEWRFEEDARAVPA